MNAILALILALSTATALASDFYKNLQNLSSHASIRRLQHVVQATQHQAKEIGAWMDPTLNITAANFPAKSFEFDKTPMTGVQVGISQKFPITDRNDIEEQATQVLAESILWQKEDAIRLLRLTAWELAISWQMKEEERQILLESHNWLEKRYRITESLYANGQSSQQALLQIKIRMADLELSIDRIRADKDQLLQNLRYLFGDDYVIETQDIPWTILDIKGEEPSREHPQEKSLDAMRAAKTLEKEAARLAKIPDITIGAGYVFRSNMDGNEDFVSLTFGIPIPITSQRSASFAAAQSSAEASKVAHEDYTRKRNLNISTQLFEIERTQSEIAVIEKQVLELARISRELVSRSYGLGDATYTEILASELSLLDIQIKQVKLWAELRIASAIWMYNKGIRLW